MAQMKEIDTLTTEFPPRSSQPLWSAVASQPIVSSLSHFDFRLSETISHISKRVKYNSQGPGQEANVGQIRRNCLRNFLQAFSNLSLSWAELNCGICILSRSPVFLHTAIVFSCISVLVQNCVQFCAIHLGLTLCAIVFTSWGSDPLILSAHNARGMSS